MSKKIHKLEKETGLWKHRWEKSHQALLEMAADKQTRDAEIEDLNRKRLLLLELCKAFQQERATLIMQLKEKTIESNSVQSENQDNVKSIEQIENFTQVSEKLGNNLSQAQESLMQDIAAQEAKRTNPKADDPPTKTEITKRKEKKKQDLKQKKNEVSIVKDETKETGEKDNVQTNTIAEEKVNQNKEDSKVKSVESKEESKSIEEIKEQETIKNSETEEIEETNRNSDTNSKCPELPKNDENLEKNCLSNSESINQIPNDIELPLDYKTENIISDKLEVDFEKVEITNEIDKLSETLKNTDLNEKSKNNECLENKLISDSNCQVNIKKNCTVSQNSQTESEKFENISEVHVLTNSENVQNKTTSCPMTAKKGKVNII